MTNFIKANFHNDSEYLNYGFVGLRGETFVRDTQFVARFKYSRRDRAGFVSFLMKNFTVEEYFARLNAGEAPAQILESKGYVSTTVRKNLRAAGYPETREGFYAFIDAQVAASAARRATGN